jgi:hypothetical protein
MGVVPRGGWAPGAPGRTEGGGRCIRGGVCRDERRITMTQLHKHTHVESRRPLRLRPLPRPGGEPEPETDRPPEAAWILEWAQPAPSDGTDA